MNEGLGQSFESIESAQDFVDLLAEAIQESEAEIREQLAALSGSETDRRKEALQLVAFKLASLSTHMAKSRRLLNDLRTLRRLLLDERQQPDEASI